MKFTAIAGFLALGLAACGPLVELPGSGVAPSHYSLNVPYPDEAKPPRQWKLFLDEPEVPGMLRLDRIAVQTSARTTEFLAAARWSDRTPKLLQTYWVEFLHSHGFENVFGGDNIEILTQHNLRISIQNFHIELDGDGVIGHVRLHALLLQNRPVEPTARQSFDASVRVPTASKEDMINALNAALDDASFQMLQWLKNVGPKTK